MGFDVVTTANNHSYDYSEAGFIKTLEHCKDKGLKQAGAAGTWTTRELRRTWTLPADGWR